MIGSEGCQALKMDRKSISIELKESYFKINEKNHRDCVAEKESTLTLFIFIGMYNFIPTSLTS